jgi:hypothetical protein
MKRTWALSPPVEVRSRTIEDDDKDGQRDANGVRHAACHEDIADATPDSLLLERKRCAQKGSAARQRQGEAGGGSEESRRIMLSD